MLVSTTDFTYYQYQFTNDQHVICMVLILTIKQQIFPDVLKVTCKRIKKHIFYTLLNIPTFSQKVKKCLQSILFFSQITCLLPFRNAKAVTWQCTNKMAIDSKKEQWHFIYFYVFITDSTNTDYFGIPMGILVESIYGNNVNTTMLPCNIQAAAPTTPLRMSLLDSLTVHAKMR